MKNSKCDGEFCIKENGEVRILPHSGGNSILCNSCFQYEMTYRRRKNKELKRMAYELKTWESLKVYNIE